MAQIDFIQLSDIDKRLNLQKTTMPQAVSLRLKRAMGYVKLNRTQGINTPVRPTYIENSADILSRLRK